MLNFNHCWKILLSIPKILKNVKNLIAMKYNNLSIKIKILNDNYRKHNMEIDNNIRKILIC
jgi:hypothetical protein